MREIIIDANILLRHLVGDQPIHFKKAKEFFAAVEKGHVHCLISIITLAETFWIMEKYYRVKRAIYMPELIKIISLKNVSVIEIQKTKLADLLGRFTRTGIDFPDHYLVAIANKRPIFSFDQDFKKLKAKTITSLK